MTSLAQRSAFVKAALALMAALTLALMRHQLGPDGRGECQGQWADVQAAYQRRENLIGNLVAVAQQSAKLEKSTLEGVIQARASATQVQLNADDLTDPAKVQAFQQAQSSMSGALSRLLVTVEQYPELKSQERFADLMTQLEGTENRINITIQDYNEAVQKYNTTIRTFPDMIGAKLIHGAKPMTPFEAKPGAENAPDVGAMFNGT